MAEFDLIIRGGTVATASDVMTCDVGVRSGRIAALGLDLGSADKVIDARGKLVLPGGIDSHVHIAQPSGPDIVQSDDFESGTRSAVFGGNTTVIPFCLQQRGEGLRRAVIKRVITPKPTASVLPTTASILIISDPHANHLLGQELPAAIGDGYSSFKVFRGLYEGLALTDEEILKVMHSRARHRRVGHGTRGKLRHHSPPDGKT